MNEIHKGLTPDEIRAYLRKSRSDDALLTVEEVLTKHEAILDEWAENNLGSKIAEENKYREVVSGETIDDRPEMLRLLKEIESPRVKAILVVEVQRLSRGDLEDAGRLIKLLRYTGTLVITPQRTYDLRDDYDRDYFERELKRGNEFLEYTKKIMNRGRLQSVQQGNYIGSVPPYGYDKIAIPDGSKKKCHTLAVKEEEATVVRLMFDLYVNKNMGFAKIAAHLDDLKIKPPKGEFWPPSTIKEALLNVHYIGKIRWNWRKNVPVVKDGEVVKTRPKAKIDEYLVFDGKHEAIVSEEIFNKAQEKAGKIPRVRRYTELKNPLAGLIFCAECGRAIVTRTETRKGQQKPPRLMCNNQTRCKTSSCYHYEIIELVCNALENAITDFEVRIKNDNSTSVKLHADLVKQLEKRQDELSKKELSLWDKYAEEAMPKDIFEKLKEKITQEKEEVHDALCKAKNSMPDPIDYEEKLLRFTDALNMLKDPTEKVEAQNAMLKQCIEKIIYSRERTVRSTSGAKGGWVSQPINLDIKLKA